MKKIITLFFVAILAVSCQKESIQPTNTPLKGSVFFYLYSPDNPSTPAGQAIFTATSTTSLTVNVSIYSPYLIGSVYLNMTKSPDTYPKLITGCPNYSKFAYKKIAVNKNQYIFKLTNRAGFNSPNYFVLKVDRNAGNGGLYPVFTDGRWIDCGGWESQF